MNTLKSIPRLYLILAAVLLFGLVVGGLWRFGVFNARPPTPVPVEFDGDRAYAHVVAQMDLGPRITGTEANVLAGDYIAKQLQQVGWQVEFQAFTYKDTPVRNVIAKTNVGKGPVIILGAHYDSRRRADQDPEHPNDPVPGADDGASGVAVLLELARTLERQQIPNEIWLAFFDAEDNGELDGWDWIIGSAYMADHLEITPQAMILLDMVGDQDQHFYYEGNSDQKLSAKVWNTAARLGYGVHFTPMTHWSMEDDHIPFVRRGIPSLDIIDFDYPDWHKTTDTTDKISVESLERIGRTVEVFLENGAGKD
jgi:glutaminyl-peptide cyclotransferase